ncbi:MAG: chromate transporter [Rubrivivax sp.]
MKPPAPRPAPRSCGELFGAFTLLALHGFGGVLPVAQHHLVERLGWLDRQQFLEMLSAAQVLPGPNVVNLALMIGDRFCGWRGALAAVAGMLLAPALIVLLLAALAAQARQYAWVAGALRGMAIVAAGLVASTAIRLTTALRGNALGRPLTAAFGAFTLLAVGVLHRPLVGVVLGLGSVAVAAAWLRLPRAPR